MLLKGSIIRISLMKAERIKANIMLKIASLIIKGLVFLSVLISLPVFAAETVHNNPVTATPNNKPLLENIQSPKVQKYLQTLDKSQAYVGGYVQSMGEGLDRFFGSKDLDVVYKKNRLIVYTPFTFYNNRNPINSVNFRAQIDLPKTNSRWKILVSSFEGDEEQNVNSLNKTEITPSNNQQTVESDTQNTFAARYLYEASKNTISHLDLGMKFINFIEPNPFVRYKVRTKNAFTKQLEARMLQNLYLERDRGFAWEGQQVFDYAINKKWLARSQTSGTWWREDAEVLINQKAVLFENVSPITARAYFVDGNWNADNQGAVFNSVALGMNIREKLYKDWLFGELEPRVTWVESDQFNEPIYSLRLMLEMHFYQ